jgi:hypothetical protein
MKAFKTGAAVRLIQPAVEGVVVGGKLSDEGDVIDYRVLYTLPSGAYHVRHFSSEELEEVVAEEEIQKIVQQHEKHLGVLKKGMELDAKMSKKHGEVEK